MDFDESLILPFHHFELRHQRSQEPPVSHKRLRLPETKASRRCRRRHQAHSVATVRPKREVGWVVRCGVLVVTPCLRTAVFAEHAAGPELRFGPRPSDGTEAKHGQTSSMAQWLQGVKAGRIYRDRAEQSLVPAVNMVDEGGLMIIGAEVDRRRAHDC